MLLDYGYVNLRLPPVRAYQTVIPLAVVVEVRKRPLLKQNRDHPNPPAQTSGHPNEQKSLGEIPSLTWTLQAP